MKNLLAIWLLLINLTSFGQLIIYSNQDTTDHFAIDTLRVSGDSCFVRVSHVMNGILFHKEDQINIRHKATATNCNGEKGADVYTIKTIFHGNSMQWYLNGQLKSRGTFPHNNKNSDWKYWNEFGIEIPEPKSRSDFHNRRVPQTYYIDGVEVPGDKKKTKHRKK